MRKKLLLATMMISVLLLCVVISACKSDTSEDYEWDAEIGGYVVKYYNPSENMGSIEIPEKYDDGIHGEADVVRIGHGAFRDVNHPISISLPQTLQVIENDAFSDISVSQLRYLDIPAIAIDKIPNKSLWGVNSGTIEIVINSGEEISKKAFNGLHTNQYFSITLPDTIKKINDDAFGGIEKHLRYGTFNIYYEGSVDEWCAIEFTNKFSNPLSAFVGEEFYCGTQKIRKELNISNNVGQYAFAGLDHPTKSQNELFRIILSENVKSIGKEAFKITSLYYDDGETIPLTSASAKFEIYYNGRINDWCSIKFEDETANPLGQAEILKIGGNQAWMDITDIEVSVDVNDYAFYNYKALTRLIIAEGCSSIGAYAFKGCTGLGGEGDIEDEIVGTGFLTHIGEHAFDGCVNIFWGRTIDADNNLSIITIGNADLSNSEWVIDVGIAEEDEEGNFIGWLPANDVVNQITGLSLSGFGIADKAFYEFKNLSWLQLEDGIKYVGDNAFGNCTSLKTIKIESPEINVDKDAFNGSNNISTAEIPVSVIDSFNKTALNTVTLFGTDWQGSGSVPNGAFSGCEKLSCVTIPDCFEEIGDHAFFGCTNLQRVTIQSKQDAGALTNNKMQRIGEQAFKGCAKLEYIDIPASVTIIGENAFAGCGKLVGGTFSVSALEHLPRKQLQWLTVIGSEIPDYAFDGCDNLSAIIIDSDIEYISEKAFEGLPNLWIILTCDSQFYKVGQDDGILYTKDGTTLVKYPVGRTSSGDISVSDSIQIPEGVTTIYDYAFSGAKSLRSITVPQTVTEIGERAFFGCSELSQINIPESVKSIGEKAFEGCVNIITYDAQGIGYVEQWVATTGVDINAEIILSNQIKGIVDAVFKDKQFNRFICQSLLVQVVEYVKQNIIAYELAYAENSMWHTRTSEYDFSYDGEIAYLNAVYINDTSVLMPMSTTIYTGDKFINITQYNITTITFDASVETIMISQDSQIHINVGAFDGNTGIKQIMIEGNVSASGLSTIDGSLYQMSDGEPILIWQKPVGSEF